MKVNRFHFSGFHNGIRFFVPYPVKGVFVKRFSILFLILLTGCSLFIKKPDVTVKSVTLTGLDTKGIGVDFLLAVANPNAYKLTLSGYRFDLYVSSVPLTSGECGDRIEFPGRSVTDVRLPAKVEFRDLLKVLKAVPDPGQVPYRLKAALNIDSPLGSSMVPLDMLGTFALPRDKLIGGILKHLK
jgi:LEA14-like dessication related protein